MLNGASNALNQIYDLEIDRINKPKRPLPSGRISIGGASIFTGGATSSTTAGGASIFTGGGASTFTGGGASILIAAMTEFANTSES